MCGHINTAKTTTLMVACDFYTVLCMYTQSDGF